MSTITDLEAKVHSLRSQLFDAERSLKIAKVEASDIKLGSIYQDRRGRRGKVVDRQVSYGGVVGILALFNKDGLLGKRQASTGWGGWVQVEDKAHG